MIRQPDYSICTGMSVACIRAAFVYIALCKRPDQPQVCRPKAVYIMSLDQALADLHNAQAAINQALTALAPAPTPMPIPQPPAPKPAPTALQRVQHWLGVSTVGIYYGIETKPWGVAQFAAEARKLKAWGVDYAMVKMGEYGRWYGGNFAAVRQAFLSAGVGCAPFYFCHPDNWQEDAAICSDLAKLAGGVVLDCEEHFLGHGTELYNLIATIRHNQPNAVIIVSGYGAPLTAFGGKWPFDAIKLADAYQPQTYFSVWDMYRYGWQAAVQWGMSQVAADFVHHGLGLSFVIQPCFSCGIRAADYQPTAAFMRKWGASVTLWEAQEVTSDIVKAVKAGMQGNK